jgi:hypothetical protein
MVLPSGLNAMPLGTDNVPSRACNGPAVPSAIASYRYKAPTGSVVISGTPIAGTILTASNSLADVDGLGPIAYQWNANGIPIDGATASSLLLTVAEVGKAITGLKNPTEQAAAAMDIFGKSGARLLPMLKSNLAGVLDEAKALGISRSSWNNWATGRTMPRFTAEQGALLRAAGPGGFQPRGDDGGLELHRNAARSGPRVDGDHVAVLQRGNRPVVSGLRPCVAYAQAARGAREAPVGSHVSRLDFSGRRNYCTMSRQRQDAR